MKEAKKLNIRYYAVLREKAGITEEEVETFAETPGELYNDLAGKYGFPVDPASIRVSVNEEFRGMDELLSSGDTVIFIPPVAGG